MIAHMHLFRAGFLTLAKLNIPELAMSFGDSLIFTPVPASYTLSDVPENGHGFT